MAVIKFGSVVTGGRGSLGGSTIQPCHSGHIWRNKPTPTKSRTQAQSIIRGYNKTMQAGWRSLSDQDRTVWNDFARSKPVFNRTGEKHPLSGHSLWMKYQFTYLSNNLPFLSNPFDYLSEPLGPEIVLNGGFVNSDHWNVFYSWSISGGKANYAQLANSYISQNMAIVANLPCKVSFDISNCPSITRMRFYNYDIPDDIFKGVLDGYIYCSNGPYFFLTETKHLLSRFHVIGYVLGSVFSIDNISIREIL